MRACSFIHCILFAFDITFFFIGWATEYIEPDIGVGAGASASFSISHSNPAYATFALSIGVGYGASIDIGNQCYAKVYEF